MRRGEFSCQAVDDLALEGGKDQDDAVQCQGFAQPGDFGAQ